MLALLLGALDALREELSMTILQPILHPEQFEAIGLSTPAGVLLFGPPGEHLAVYSVRLPGYN